MALIINTALTLPSGIIVDNSYARVTGTISPDGKLIHSDIKLYNSKQSYLNNLEEIRMVNINRYITKPYNREIDGVDTLSLAHDILIVSLLEQGIVAVKELI